MEEDKLGGKERWQQMITVILVSHGGMAKGMVESTTMLIGEQPDLAFITFEPEDGVEDLTDVVSQLGEDASAEQLCEGTLKPSREAMIDVNAWMKELGILE